MGRTLISKARHREGIMKGAIVLVALILVVVVSPVAVLVIYHAPIMGWLKIDESAATALLALTTATATIVLAATTIVYAWHTWQLVKENRLLRKAGTDPQVVAFAIINPHVYGAIDFVMANVGKGPARMFHSRLFPAATISVHMTFVCITKVSSFRFCHKTSKSGPCSAWDMSCLRPHGSNRSR